MSVMSVIATVIECTLGGIIIWGFWNEEKFVEFEDKFFAKMGIVRAKKHSAKITDFKSSEQRRAVSKAKHCI